MHGYKMHTHEVYPHEIHGRKMPAYKVHAHERSMLIHRRVSYRGMYFRACILGIDLIDERISQGVRIL